MGQVTRVRGDDQHGLRLRTLEGLLPVMQGGLVYRLEPPSR